MNRINKKDLEGQLEVINKLTDGTYIINYANGGVRLNKLADDPCGLESNISDRFTKRELYEFMRAFIKGIHAINDLNRS
jgi:hypothetical protein|tara:strand:- start:1617 stop:1853 length:237 start_codon:yes stop_codon:yes gene_type:complete